MNPRAVIRRSPDDFVVDELPAYEACGEGEHLFVRIRKRGTTTLDALSALCRALDVDVRSAGFAGMKDRHAVTTQTLSLPFPLARPIDDARRLALPGIDVLEVARHRNKLKPGHLVGNRFRIVLREIDPASLDGVVAALEAAGKLGVPNAFGPQRFGRDGDNAERALAWLSGRDRGPRDKRAQRLLFSALQSRLFNLVLARRVERGTWWAPLRGDLVKKRETGGLFLCDDPDADRPRAERGEIAPTGPIFGAKMRWPEGEAAEIEREILLREAGAKDAFDRHRHLGEGSRRALRLLPEGLSVERMAEDPRALAVTFVLPKGGYATTVLAVAATLEDWTAQSARDAESPSATEEQSIERE